MGTIQSILQSMFNRGTIGVLLLSLCGCSSSGSNTNSSGQIPVGAAREATYNAPTCASPSGMPSTCIIQTPIPSERFVSGEPISLTVASTYSPQASDSSFEWYSDTFGDLGSGRAFKFLPTLSPGAYHFGLKYNGNVVSGVDVRIYSDLDALFQEQPSSAEITRVQADFNLQWIDTTGNNETWSGYSEWAFNLTSDQPSKLIGINYLDVLRHQRFSRALPFSTNSGIHFTIDQTPYDFIKNVKNINFYLYCQSNHANRNLDTIYLNRSLSTWFGLTNPDLPEADQCKNDSLSVSLDEIHYGGAGGLLVHEARHLMTADPGHNSASCTNLDGRTLLPGQGDQSFDITQSGYSYSLFYSIWVYNYGLFDTQAEKALAKQIGTLALKGKFCQSPQSSDPAIQSTINDWLSTAH